MRWLVLGNPLSADDVADEFSPLRRGDQVVYIPPHLQNHMDTGVPLSYPNGAQPGFISSGPNDHGDYFVRYWAIDEEGNVCDDLRTKANSECTKAEWLFMYVSKPETIIQEAIEKYG